MIIRPPILFSQLKAGNNSEKLNKINNIPNSLYNQKI